MKQAFVAMEVIDGTVKVYAGSLDDTDNLNGYNDTGNWISSSLHKTFLNTIAAIAQQQFDNYKGIERMLKNQQNIENWSDYSLLE